MNQQYLLTILVGAVLVLFIIYRQVQRRPVEDRQLVVLPLVLAALGLVNLNHQPPTTTAAVTALVASLVSAVLLGLARGRSMRVWQEAGSILRQGTPITVGLWVVAIVLRIVIGALAHHAGVAQSVTLGELPLVTLAGQNLLIWLRAQALSVAPRPASRGAP